MARGRGDFLLRHHNTIARILRLALCGMGLYSRGARNALALQVRRFSLYFPGLPHTLRGFRILHLSDLHIDGVPGLAEMLADRLSRLPVDVCVITGDYRFEVDGPYDHVYPHMRTIVRAVCSRHGIFGVLGNHDPADLALALEQLGVRMLINESMEITDGFWAIGVDDSHYYGCDDLSEPLKIVPSRTFKLLLAHSPELYADAAAADIDLYLCGHTHAGQICLPGQRALMLNAICPRLYTRGIWTHGKTQGFTTSGAGCSLLPVRFNCPPEIAVIELLPDPLS